MWHERTRELRETGRIRTVGIIQEQHPGRARLFMQWKGMDWPVLVDSLDLLDVSVVPITVLIDEAGIVWKVGARSSDLEAFVADEPAATRTPSVAPARRPDLEAPAAADDPGALRRYADTLVLFGGGGGLDKAIDAYGRVLGLDPDDGRAHFRLGVAYRRRAETDDGVRGDFARAVRHWRRALDIDPDQYIWRRRIQQYGPRLDKPYPFYDWVTRARDEIETRGEVPWPLAAEPSGAEFARPQRSFTSAEAAEPPDPDGRIRRDERGLVQFDAVAVPHTAPGRAAARVHLRFQPNRAVDVHWNNEAGDMEVWLDPPAGWDIDRRRIVVPRPGAVVSVERRTIEVELRRPGGPPGGPVTIPGYALYYVCEGPEGTCLYLRQDLEIELSYEAGSP